MSIPQLLAGLEKAEREAAGYRAELERQRRLLDAAIGGSARNGAAKARPARRGGGGRKLVDDALLVAALKRAGKAGIAASELGKQFKLTGGQVSAVLQRLAREKLAKSNGVRGRGGRWRAV
jgi:hypothetical protein